MDPRSRLHPDLHPHAQLAPDRVVVLVRLVGVAIVDVLLTRSQRHAGPLALLIVLATLANLGALVWLFGWARRAPLQTAALGGVAFAGGLLAALQHGSPALAFPAVAVLQVAAEGSVLEAVGTFALALIALEIGVVWAKLGVSPAVGYPAVLVGAALIGLIRRQYIAQVRVAEALVTQTQRTEEASRRAATLDERTRIAREIHDVLAHALGGLAVQLEAAELLLDERRDVDGALERIRASRSTAREGLTEARRAVSALRSDTPPLPVSLAGLIESHREQGASGELSVEGEPRTLTPEISLALMRAAQEALTNARRHAPGSAVRVRLIFEAASTSLIVSNQSTKPASATVGADDTSGYGLEGMRERLELAGGRLAAGPSEDGWTVHAEAPS